MSGKCPTCGSYPYTPNPFSADKATLDALVRAGDVVTYTVRNIPSESEAHTMRYCASLADKYAQSFDEAYIPLYDFAKKLRELADVHEQILAEDMNTEQPCICGNRKHRSDRADDPHHLLHQRLGPVRAGPGAGLPDRAGTHVWTN